MPGGSETTTTEAPKEVTEYFNKFINPAAEGISNMQFESYTGDRVAGLSDLETSALSRIGGLSGDAAAAMQPGLSTLGEAQAAYGKLGDIASMTPEDYRRRTEANLSGYTTGVIDPALARMDRAAAEARTQQQAEFAKAGGFGNERRGIYEAELAARQGESRDELISNLMRQGYNEAQAATMAQMGQGIGAQQAAAAGLAGVGSSQAGLGLQGQAAELQALQAQLAAGGLQRGVDQAGLEAQYQEFMRQQQFPLQQFAALTGGSAAYPSGGTSTTTTRAGFGDILSGFANAAMAAPYIFPSDRRLKKNITLLNTVNGVNYYRWQWNDEAKRIGASSTPPVGVIAQELQETHPHLVVTGTDGYLMVNYGGLAD
jgi:hypothetical protein